MTSLIILSTIFLPVLSQACPGCAAAMDSTLGKGFNMSTLFMMAMPFFVIGSIAIGLVVIYQNKQKILNKNTHNQEEE